MASPWSFLTRLVSPQRRKKRDDGSTEGVKPDALAIVGSTETPVKKNLADQPKRERAEPLLQSEPVAAELEPRAETGSDIQVSGESVDNEGEHTSDPASPHLIGTRAHAAPTVDENVKAEPANRRRHVKMKDAVAIVSQASQGVPPISDEMSLDTEIRALRGQLASKLRLQNTQLKQMLGRFER